jgi:hypothetical protein
MVTRERRDAFPHFLQIQTRWKDNDVRAHVAVIISCAVTLSSALRGRSTQVYQHVNNAGASAARARGYGDLMLSVGSRSSP